jgi:hypothetical protein
MVDLDFSDGTSGIMNWHRRFIPWRFEGRYDGRSLIDTRCNLAEWYTFLLQSVSSKWVVSHHPLAMKLMNPQQLLARLSTSVAYEALIIVLVGY